MVGELRADACTCRGDAGSCHLDDAGLTKCKRCPVLFPYRAYSAIDARVATTDPRVVTTDASVDATRIDVATAGPESPWPSPHLVHP